VSVGTIMAVLKFGQLLSDNLQGAFPYDNPRDRNVPAGIFNRNLCGHANIR